MLKDVKKGRWDAFSIDKTIEMAQEIDNNLENLLYDVTDIIEQAVIGLPCMLILRLR